MSKSRDRFVSQRPDGSWANKRNDANKVSSIHQTQAEAIRAAHEMLTNQGGGEPTVQGRHGQIMSKDTIAPGNDPRSIREIEH